MRTSLRHYVLAALLLPLVNTVSSQELSMTVESRHVFGRFLEGDPVAAFDSRRADDGLFDVMVELDGVVLTAVIDRENGIAILDGYFSDDGTDAYMSRTDRSVLHRFNEELSGRLSNLDDSGRYLQHAVSIWSEYPATLTLTRSVEGSSIQSLCNYLGLPFPATHDDGYHGLGDDASTLDEAIVSPPTLGSCANADKTWFFDGGWQCFEADHDSRIEGAKGNCFGNCGGDCSGGGLQMTRDCHNHDQCVRNGHDLASLWCNDEFTDAIDDELNAPNCSTGASVAADERPRPTTDLRSMTLEAFRGRVGHRAPWGGLGRSESIRQRRILRLTETIDQRLHELRGAPQAQPLTDEQRAWRMSQKIDEQMQDLEAKQQRLSFQTNAERNRQRIEEILQEIKKAQREAQR